MLNNLKVRTDIADMTKSPEQVPIPKGRAIITSLGPGLVLSMAFLGTGDLVSSSVSGANYGYTLMWSLILALVCRTFIISTIAKYTLCNRFGDTQIFEGFKRLSSSFPIILSFIVIIAGFTNQCTMLNACGTALYGLISAALGYGFAGIWGIFICALLTMAVTIYMVTQKKQFKIFEYIARITSVIVIIFYLATLVKLGHFDIVGFLKGCFTFNVTGNDAKGLFGPLVVACSTIGAVGGNMPNLLYSGFMKDKGWVGPKYRKLQMLDLITGMAPLFLINMLFWAVATEAVYSKGGTLETIADLANMMQNIIGPMGPVVLWICIFGAAFTSFPSQSRGFAQLAVNGLHLGTKSGQKWIDKDEEDPKFRIIQMSVFVIIPIIASIPGAPDMIVLNVLGTALATCISLPVIIVGIIMLTSSKKYMMSYAVNKPWQTVVLVLLGAIAFFTASQLIPMLPNMFFKAFGSGL